MTFDPGMPREGASADEVCEALGLLDFDRIFADAEVRTPMEQQYAGIPAAALGRGVSGPHHEAAAMTIQA